MNSLLFIQTAGLPSGVNAVEGIDMVMLAKVPGERKGETPKPLYYPPPEDVRPLLDALTRQPTNPQFKLNLALSLWLDDHPEHVRPIHLPRVCPRDLGEVFNDYYKWDREGFAAWKKYPRSAPLSFGVTSLFDRKAFAFECADAQWLATTAKFHEPTGVPWVSVIRKTDHANKLIRLMWFSQVSAG